MKRSTIAAFCMGGFIAGCNTAPHTVEITPVYTLVAVEAAGPGFWELREYWTKTECEKAAKAEPLTDAIAFCIQKGMTR